jgi:hypothetical protein
MYFSDDGEVMAVRVGDYKFTLAVQRATRMMQWAEPLVKLRLPLIFNLRRDPFERADVNSNTYFDWMVDHVPQLYLMQATVAAEIDNFVTALFIDRESRGGGARRIDRAGVDDASARDGHRVSADCGPVADDRACSGLPARRDVARGA